MKLSWFSHSGFSSWDFRSSLSSLFFSSFSLEIRNGRSPPVPVPFCLLSLVFDKLDLVCQISGLYQKFLVSGLDFLSFSDDLPDYLEDIPEIVLVKTDFAMRFEKILELFQRFELFWMDVACVFLVVFGLICC